MGVVELEFTPKADLIFSKEHESFFLMSFGYHPRRLDSHFYGLKAFALVDHVNRIRVELKPVLHLSIFVARFFVDDVLRMKLPLFSEEIGPTE